MKEIYLNAWNSQRYTGIAEILLVLGPHILNLRWVLELSEIAPGPGTAMLEAIAHPISTTELIHGVTPDIQVIDGKFLGYDLGGNLVVSITAVDSSSWDVRTESDSIYSALLDHFKDSIIQ